MTWKWKPQTILVSSLSLFQSQSDPNLGSMCWNGSRTHWISKKSPLLKVTYERFLEFREGIQGIVGSEASPAYFVYLIWLQICRSSYSVTFWKSHSGGPLRPSTRNLRTCAFGGSVGSWSLHPYLANVAKAFCPQWSLSNDVWAESQPLFS